MLSHHALRNLAFRAHAGQEVDKETDDVAGEDGSDDPLHHGGHVTIAAESQVAKDDGEADLDEDEGQLDPEGGA